MSLQYCLSGGEPLNPEVMEQWKSMTGLQIYDLYGQTETVGAPVYSYAFNDLLRWR